MCASCFYILCSIRRSSHAREYRICTYKFIIFIISALYYLMRLSSVYSQSTYLHAVPAAPCMHSTALCRPFSLFLLVFLPRSRTVGGVVRAWCFTLRFLIEMTNKWKSPWWVSWLVWKYNTAGQNYPLVWLVIINCVGEQCWHILRLAEMPHKNAGYFC